MTDPVVSVITINFNSWDHLETMIASVEAQAFDGGIEVVVVDNGSTDDSLGRIRRRFRADCGP